MTTFQKPSYDHLKSLQVLYNEGHFKKALDIANELITHFPNSTDLLNIIGTLNYELKNYKKAIYNYKKVLKTTPNYKSVIFFNIANCYKASGKLNTAIFYYKEALITSPQNINVIYNLGNTYLLKKNIDEAKKCYQKVLELNSNHSGSSLELGKIMLAENNLDSAITLFEIALNEYPNNSGIYLNLGFAYKEKGFIKRAISKFQIALKINPNCIKTIYNLGICHSFLKDFDKAILCFQNVIKSDPTNSLAFNGIGKSFYEIGDFKKAKTYFHKALKIDSNNPDSLFGNALLLKKLGKYKEAKNLFYKVLQLDKKDIRGSNLQLAAMGFIDLPDKTPENFLINYYKNKSKTWGAGSTNYRGRTLIEEAFKKSNITKKQESILDIGCGTGALAKFLYNYTNSLYGVDISSDMIIKAKETNLYKELYNSELIKFLCNKNKKYSLIVAAATLIHFKKLDQIFSLVKRRLLKNGYFVFSVFESLEKDIDLNENLFYKHSINYINKLSQKTEFSIKYSKRSIHEYHHNNKKIFALVFVLTIGN